MLQAAGMTRGAELKHAGSCWSAASSREPLAAKGSRRAGWDAGLGREAHRTSFSAVKKGIVAKRISSSSRLHSLPPRAAQLRG